MAIDLNKSIKDVVNRMSKAYKNAQTGIGAMVKTPSADELRARNPYSFEDKNAFNNIQNKMLNTTGKEAYGLLNEFRQSPIANKYPIPPKRAELEQQVLGAQTQQGAMLTSMPVEPQATPVQGQTLQPIQPVTPGIEQYQSDYPMNPELYDAVMRADIPVDDPNEQVGGMNVVDYIRRLVMNQGARESSGGTNLYGDTHLANPSYGPYHIRAEWRTPHISKEDAMDFDKATKYIIDEILRNKKAGKNYDQWLKSWNENSGYRGNPGPKYDVDIPRQATASAFKRGK